MSQCLQTLSLKDLHDAEIERLESKLKERTRDVTAQHLHAKLQDTTELDDLRNKNSGMKAAIDLMHAELAAAKQESEKLRFVEDQLKAQIQMLERAVEIEKNTAVSLYHLFFYFYKCF